MMIMQTHELKINPEYREMVPIVDSANFQRLVEDIRTAGQYYKIVVNQDYVILDGHHRYFACKELGIDPQFEVRPFYNKLDEMEFVIKANVKRRQLTVAQLTSLALKLEDIAAQRARDRQKELAGTRPNKEKTDLEADLPQGSKNKRAPQSEEIAAKEVGLKRKQYQKAKEILKNGSEELKQKFFKNEVSTDYAYKSVKRSQDHNKIPPLPQGHFSIIVADPPWNYDIDTRGSPNEHYAVMTQQDIELLKVPSADNAMLFLWATNPKLKQALDVMAAWGFKYKTNMVWVKDKIGTGYYARGKHELLLIGEKGDMPVPEEQSRPASVIEAPRGKHSEKPDQAYQIIEQMYPNRQSYLELFARKQHSENWVVWGNEIDNA